MARLRSFFLSAAPYLAAIALTLLTLPVESNKSAVTVVKWWGVVIGDPAVVSEPPNAFAVAGNLDSQEVRYAAAAILTLSAGVMAIMYYKRPG